MEVDSNKILSYYFIRDVGLELTKLSVFFLHQGLDIVYEDQFAVNVWAKVTDTAHVHF